jgi:23S rRNA U2552 (ribose-2'-O)-methylase RlmE/FtsJ
MRAGDRVLDLGCRPGSWLQYALKAVEVAWITGTQSGPSR